MAAVRRCQMRSRLFGTLLLVGVLAASVLTAVAPTRKVALVTFQKPMIVAGVALMGPVVFEHDDAKMARGEPCTTVYRYDSQTNGPGQVLVAFMCVPKDRPLATRFEATISRVWTTGAGRLTEYQFAGDHEGHGVPYSK
jgi:hypothetical protein